MQQSRHIGKIVVAYDDQPMLVKSSAVPDASLSLKSDATYLIAGGLGGVGLATARWMAEKGARCLVLLGRRGAVSSDSREAVAEL